MGSDPTANKERVSRAREFAMWDVAAPRQGPVGRVAETLQRFLAVERPGGKGMRVLRHASEGGHGNRPKPSLPGHPPAIRVADASIEGDQAKSGER